MRFARAISRYLLLVMLATVFSPSFGWEALEGMPAPAQAVMAAQDDHHDHAAMADMHDHDMAACDGSLDHDSGPCNDLQHHCCPGHVLGHLPGGLSSGLQLPVPDADSVVLDGQLRPFSSHIAEGLERPPRAAA